MFVKITITLVHLLWLKWININNKYDLFQRKKIRTLINYILQIHLKYIDE